MVRDEHEVAVRSWIVAALDGLGIEVVYAPQAPGVAPPPMPYVTVRGLSYQPETEHDDEVSYLEDDDEDAVQVHRRGFFVGSVSVQCIGDGSPAIVSALRSSLRDPAIQLLLAQLGLSVRRIGAEIDVPEQRGSVWIRRRSVDVEVAFARHGLTLADAVGEVQPTSTTP